MNKSIIYSISFAKNNIHVVRKFDNHLTEFISIPDYELSEFFKKATLHFPLFILEKVYKTDGDRKFVVFTLLCELLKKEKSQVKILDCGTIPVSFQLKCKSKNIHSNYVKTLYLSSFF